MLFTEITNWLSINYIEVIGALLGSIYVILAAKENVWCWFFGIINVLIYVYIFFQSQLFGEMILQIFYLLMSFYGLYVWLKKTDNKQNKNIKISNIKIKTLINAIITTIIIGFGFGYLLTYTSTNVPYFDGIATALGITGTWMTARKYIENWIWWVFANIYCIGIYYYKELYPTIGFYVIITILAVIGYFQWKKAMKNSIG